MPPLKSLLGALFGASNRLSDLEKRILDCVRAHLDERVLPLWDKQIQAINKVQRLPEGVEVNFYRMKGGRPTFDAELVFPGLAKVRFRRLQKNTSPLLTLSVPSNLWMGRYKLLNLLGGASAGGMTVPLTAQTARPAPI